MQIELRLKEITSPDFLPRTYDPDDDDVRSILIDVCRAIGNRSEFVVSGFGQARWPLDVQTDLPVFLEQLPFALRAVNEGMAAEIDFYEQGIERSIALAPADGGYVAKCASRTGWQPSPAVEELDRDELVEMLLMTRERFMRAFKDMAPELAEHQWIRQWLKGLPEQG
jgi:hypothetical protein